MQFTGRLAEYYRIWLVGVALSVLTLGIHSAWAKARKRRYLYHHTCIDGSGLDYRASPVAILRGRIVVIATLGTLALAGHLFLELQLVLIALLVLLSPWIAVASARFNARNTFYRNVPFGFDGRLREAAKVILGFGLVAIVTLGLAYPWARMRRARFLVNGHRFGATPFTARFSTGAFVRMYGLAALAAFGCVLLFGATLGVLAALLGGDRTAAWYAFLPGVVATYAGYVVVFAFVKARTRDIVLGGTAIGALWLESRVSARRLAWLYVSNIVGIVATLGLATPWATLRLARYYATTLTVMAPVPLAAMPGRAPSQAGAAGSEAGDLFDMDIAL